MAGELLIERTPLVLGLRAEIARLRDDLAASERLRTHAVKELGKDSALVERMQATLLSIAHMDIYTRPGEQPAQELMRDLAKAALGEDK